MELWLRSYRQLKEYGVDRPTHVFVQAGVGSLAGAVQGYVASIYDECPITVVVEADELIVTINQQSWRWKTKICWRRYANYNGRACLWRTKHYR
ncbi:diaminopropionate ammonia-lyase domain protein, partial [Clostridioides difficile CD206]